MKIQKHIFLNNKNFLLYNFSIEIYTIYYKKLYERDFPLNNKNVFPDFHRKFSLLVYIELMIYYVSLTR